MISEIVVRPSVSNTDTITQLKVTTPLSNYSMVENPILYGGSAYFSMGGPGVEELFKFIPSIDQEVAVEVYILNSFLIVWCEQFNKGLQIDYRALILHATMTVDGEECIYLQIESDTTATDIDHTLELIMKYRGGDREELALFRELNLQNIVGDTSKAISMCTSFHIDSSGSEEETPLFEQPQIPSFPIIDNTKDIVLLEFDQNNVADDLNNEDICDDDYEGGMVVDVGNGPLSGTVRTRDDSDHQYTKIKRNR